MDPSQAEEEVSSWTELERDSIQEQDVVFGLGSWGLVHQMKYGRMIPNK